MDKKKSTNTQGGRSNGNNNNNRAKANDKALIDTTLGLSNLQLGQTNNGAAKPKNSSGKKTSKKSTSSSNGSSVAASLPVSSKKAGPILLGMPDSPMEVQDDVDPYVTKIGGVPVSILAEDEKLFCLWFSRLYWKLTFQLHYQKKIAVAIRGFASTLQVRCL
jgi:pre-rRNA-processing protein TSR4